MVLKKLINKFQNKVVIKKNENPDEEFIELEPEATRRSAKIFLKYFTLTEFADIKPVIDNLREGYTIALIYIRPLKDRDMSELKRAIGKIKRTCEAIEGNLVGINEDYVVAVPNFVEIDKGEYGNEEETE